MLAPRHAARYTTFVTTSLPTREADSRSFLENFPRWATDARTVLAVLGIVLYAVLRIAYSVFYSNFGLTPDDLGLGYLDLLIQSAVGTVMLLMAMFIVAALVVTVYVGIWGQPLGQHPRPAAHRIC